MDQVRRKQLILDYTKYGLADRIMELEAQLAEARTGLNVAVRLLCLVNVNDEQCVDTGDMTDSEYRVYTAWCRQVE